MIARPPLVAARRPRRGFTLLETALAMTMGSMVILAVVTTFSALRRADARTAAASDAAVYMARAHRTFSNAFSTIVMAEPRTAVLNTPPPASGGAGGAGGTETPPPAPTPRLRLDADLATGHQRLEMLLIQPPILGARPTDGSPEPRGAVRGVFALRRRENFDGTLSDTRFDLYWSTLKPLPAGADPDSRREVLGSTVVAEDVASVEYTLWRSSTAERGTEPKLESQRGLTALQESELPAYAEVEIRMTSGQRQKWLFEINWTRGAEPVLPDPLDASGAGGAGGKDGDGAPGQPGGGGGTGPKPGDARPGSGGAGGSSSSSRSSWDSDRARQEAARQAEEGRVREQPR